MVTQRLLELKVFFHFKHCNSQQMMSLSREIPTREAKESPYSKLLTGFERYSRDTMFSSDINDTWHQDAVETCNHYSEYTAALWGSKVFFMELILLSFTFTQVRNLLISCYYSCNALHLRIRVSHRSLPGKQQQQLFSLQLWGRLPRWIRRGRLADWLFICHHHYCQTVL